MPKVIQSASFSLKKTPREAVKTKKMPESPPSRASLLYDHEKRKKRQRPTAKIDGKRPMAKAYGKRLR